MPDTLSTYYMSVLYIYIYIGILQWNMCDSFLPQFIVYMLLFICELHRCLLYNKHWKLKESIYQIIFSQSPENGMIQEL